MTIEYIFETFRALETVAERVAYLQELATLSLPFEINYEALINAWLASE